MGYIETVNHPGEELEVLGLIVIWDILKLLKH